MAVRIGFVGAGQMARALARGLVRVGIAAAEEVIASDPVAAARDEFALQLPQAEVVKENTSVWARAAELVILAVKPQSLSEVLVDSAACRGDRLVLSIVAGARIATLQDKLGHDRIIRAMPNTPCLVGRGASAYACGGGVTSSDRALAERLLGGVGIARPVIESQLDAVTGLSGSGPAYVCLMIEALADGGVREGLPRDLALRLATETVRGAAELLLETGEHPAQLKDRVASPGGTTIAGLQTLEERAVRGALIAAVQAAARRSRELS